MRILVSIVLLVILGCKTNPAPQVKESKDMEFTPQFISGPPVLVYKTKANYDNLVPVLLSEDRTEVISYPDPADIKIGDKFPSPTLLNKGYLLDNRGISSNVAFLSLTYEEYTNFDKTLSLKELYSLIKDKNPIIELCDCGNRKAFKDIVPQLNNLIDNNRLRTVCKIIK